MNRLRFSPILTLAIAVFSLSSCVINIRGTGESREPSNKKYAEQPMRETDKASAIHKRVLVLDTHVDIPTNFATRDVDPGVDGALQVDLPKMAQGGLDAAFFIVYVGQTKRSVANYNIARQMAINKFNAIHRGSRKKTFAIPMPGSKAPPAVRPNNR